MIEQAFPESQNCYGGMTLRDYFAAKAIPHALAHALARERALIEAAREAYRIADAMLAARAEVQSE